MILQRNRQDKQPPTHDAFEDVGSNSARSGGCPRRLRTSSVGLHKSPIEMGFSRISFAKLDKSPVEMDFSRLSSIRLDKSPIEMDFSRISSVRLDKSRADENQHYESYTRCLNPSFLIMVTHKNIFFRGSLSSKMA